MKKNITFTFRRPKNINLHVFAYGVKTAPVVIAIFTFMTVALAHMVDATSWTLVVALAHRGVGGGMITFVALAHMVDATSLTLVVALAHRGGGGGGMIAFVALAHMVDATSLTLVVALAHMVDATSLTLVVALAHMVDATSLTLVVALAHRGVGGWDDNVRCSCTHGWCYVFNFSCCTLTLLALTLSNFLQSCRFFERLQGPEGWKKWRSASCNQKITWNVKVLNARSFKFKFL